MPSLNIWQQADPPSRRRSPPAFVGRGSRCFPVGSPHHFFNVSPRPEAPATFLASRPVSLRHRHTCGPHLQGHRAGVADPIRVVAGTVFKHFHLRMWKEHPPQSDESYPRTGLHMPGGGSEKTLGGWGQEESSAEPKESLPPELPSPATRVQWRTAELEGRAATHSCHLDSHR